MYDKNKMQDAQRLLLIVCPYVGRLSWLESATVYLTATVPDLDALPPLQHDQGPVEGLFAVAPGVAELTLQRRQAGRPADGQPAAQLVLVALEGAVDMYKVKNKGKCPKNQQDLKTAGVVKKVKKDPWGKLYEIKCPGEHGDIDVMSAGPDGDFGTPDDINSWDEGSEEGDEKKK